jgi:hypothetical protein
MKMEGAAHVSDVLRGHQLILLHVLPSSSTVVGADNNVHQGSRVGRSKDKEIMITVITCCDEEAGNKCSYYQLKGYLQVQRLPGKHGQQPEVVLIHLYILLYKLQH